MDTFFKLNKEKLKFAFAATLLILLGLVLLVLIIAYFTKTLPDTKLIITILLTTTIVAPVFIISIVYLVGLFNHKLKRKLFSRAPFDKLENIGFYKSYLNIDNKWQLTEEIRECKIEGFTLKCNLALDKKNTIEIEAPTEWKKLDKNEYKRLSGKLKNYNIDFRIGSLVKLYETNQLILRTEGELKEDIKHFTDLLRQESFEPKKKGSA